MPVTRDDVIRTAIDLLDEVGLAGLTLRRLAERLDIKAPTLYWHVRNKRELLDLMAVAMVGDVLDDLRTPRPEQTWWEWLTERSVALRAALLAHRDSVLVVSGNRPTSDVIADIECQLAALVEAGFPPREALLAILSVGAFIMGDTLDTQAEAERSRVAAEEDLGARPPGLVVVDPRIVIGRMLASGSFPVLAAAAEGFGGDPEERFAYGIAVVIAGLRERLAQLTRLAPPSAG